MGVGSLYPRTGWIQLYRPLSSLRRVPFSILIFVLDWRANVFATRGREIFAPREHRGDERGSGGNEAERGTSDFGMERESGGEGGRCPASQCHLCSRRH